MPRADLLTWAQAKQMHFELLAGCDQPAGMPLSVTRTIAIADTGCARSMANHTDHFKPGSIHQSESDVSGASGAFKNE